ncbi:glycosyltransferase [Roseobacteraceae bacterium S113]
MPASPPQRRILHVIAHIEKAGAERQLSLLVAASRHDHVIAVLPGNEGPSAAKVELLAGRNPRANIRIVSELIDRYDIEIVQLWLPDIITFPAMWSALRAKCRIISGDRRRVRNQGRAALRDRTKYVTHVAADVVVPNYPYLPPALSLRRLLGIPRRVETILNGLELTPQPRPITTAPNKLLFVGRLMPQKRVDIVLDNLPALLKDTPLTHFDIVGPGGRGSCEAALRAQIAKLGIGPDVTLHGLHRDWGARFDPTEHLLVLPSASEGMSNTVFEAIAWGFMPLVAQSPELDLILRDWPEKPEMFDLADPASLSRAVTKLLDTPPQQTQARIRAMQARLDDFSVPKMATAYDALYDRLGAQQDQRRETRT